MSYKPISLSIVHFISIAKESFLPSTLPHYSLPNWITRRNACVIRGKIWFPQLLLHLLIPLKWKESSFSTLLDWYRLEPQSSFSCVLEWRKGIEYTSCMLDLLSFSYDFLIRLFWNWGFWMLRGCYQWKQRMEGEPQTLTV